MIYLIDPIRALVVSNRKASLEFLCPNLTERFRPVLKSIITGQAEISDIRSRVRISGQCTEGVITIEAAHPNYILALKKARREFAQFMNLWIHDRYGFGDGTTYMNSLLETEQVEAERIRLVHQERTLI